MSSGVLAAAGLADLESEWSAVAAASPLGVFGSPEWLAAVERSFGGGRIVVAEARVGGRLIGLAPMRFRWRPPLRVLSFAAMGTTAYGVADYGGVIAAAGHEHDAARQVVGLMAARRDWNLADLQQVPDGATAGALRAALEEAGLHVQSRVQNLCHRVPLPATWAEYRERLSANMRDWLERKPRKLERDAGAMFERVPPGEVLAEYQTLHELVRARHGFAASSDFHARAHLLMSSWLPAAVARDYVRMFRVRSGSRTIAVLLGYEAAGTFYFHTSGYDQDPRWSPYSLGGCLLAGALRWSIEHRLRTFDLMRGDYPYKARLGSVAVPNHRLTVFRSAALSALVRRALPIRSRALGQLRRTHRRLRPS